jgi:hypothetical protein
MSNPIAIPAVSVTYAQAGTSTTANALVPGAGASTRHAPALSDEFDVVITEKVRESRKAREQSKQLLEIVKTGVRRAILF